MWVISCIPEPVLSGQIYWCVKTKVNRLEEVEAKQIQITTSLLTEVEIVLM